MGNSILAYILVLFSVVGQAETCVSYFAPKIETFQILYRSQDQELIEALSRLGIEDVQKPSSKNRVLVSASQDSVGDMKKIPGVLAVIKLEIRSDTQESGDSLQGIQSLESSKPEINFTPAAEFHLENLEAIRYEKYGKRQLRELVLDNLYPLLKAQNIYEFSDKDFIEFMDAYLNKQTPVRDILNQLVR